MTGAVLPLLRRATMIAVRPRPSPTLLGAGLAAVTVLSVSTSAQAYCRTASCGDGTIGDQCEPARPGDCDLPLYWAEPCVGYSMQRDGSSLVDLETARALMERAFDAWTQADCGAGMAPGLVVQQLEDVECNIQEYNAESGNANAVIFVDEDWPYGQASALALTTVTFNIDSGEIRDVDMEVNSAEIALTTGDQNVNFDLLSILTHEAGHFLGLAHSTVDGATMERDYVPGSIDLRSLEADDSDGICAIYPAEAAPTNCEASPRGGLQSECENPPLESGCCSIAPGSRSEDSHGRQAVAAVLMASALLARRRRRCNDRVNK